MARRRYQRGQLTRDGDRWVARWREDLIEPDGRVRRVRKWDVIASIKDCPTQRLAQRRLDERLRAINREDYRPTPSITFADFAERWIETVMVQHKLSTQEAERSTIRAHLLPGLWADGTLRVRRQIILDSF